MNRQSAARRRVKKRKSPIQNSRVKFSVFIGIMVLAVVLGYLTARFVVGPVIGYDADESPAKIAGQDEEKDKDKDKDGETEEGASGEADSTDAADSVDAADSADEAGDAAGAVSGSVPTDGYALQFGVFSTQEAAETLAESLKEQGIDTKIVKMEDVYKVISPVFDSKEEALTGLEALAEKNVEDVFVTSFE